MLRKFIPTVVSTIIVCSLCFAATTTVSNSGLTFSPANITITQGDTVLFTLAGSHSAIEVDQTTYNANGNTPIGGGFTTPLGGGTVTGLSVGVHYYVCSIHFGSGMKGTITVNAAVPTLVIPNVWVNEIHYDNTGTDSLEGYEIAGPAGTNLACYEVILYNGANGLQYLIDTLSGVIPAQACGYGTAWFQLQQDGIQNGAPDGIVLVYAPQETGCGVNNVDTVLQFLSYEGTFTATNGRAIGMNSTAIPVSESASTTILFSLQLSGVGTSYSQFTWASAAMNTYNLPNNNQFFCGAPQAGYYFSPINVTRNEGDGLETLAYVHATNVIGSPQTIDIVFKGGSGSISDLNNYTTQTLTFNPGVDSLPFTVTITDDILIESTETFAFVLRNPSNNGTIDTDSTLILNLTDNDINVPHVSFGATTASVSESGVSINVDVNISNPNSNPTSVDIPLMGGSATLNTDYSYSPTTVTFPANSSTAQTVTITINEDAFVEGNEDFTLMLMNATNSAIIDAADMFTLNIIDNDGLQLNIYPHAQTAVENTGTVNVPVLLNNLSQNPTSVTVKLKPQGTTATFGTDFTFMDTTLTWAANTSGTMQVPVQIIDDNIYEYSDTVVIVITNPTNGAIILDSTMVIDITDNDPLTDANCSDLFFSEYIKGSSNNKALEIFNPTNHSIELNDYRIFKSTNGGSSTGIFGLKGTLASKDVFVVANSSADTIIKMVADSLSGFFNFTGNDALALLHLNDTIDVIGEIGVDPGSAGWSVDTGSTAGNTLIRNYYTYKGSNNWDINSEQWNAHHLDMLDSLGFHNTATCGTAPPPPPASINFVSATNTVVEGDTLVEVVVEVQNSTGTNADFAIARDDAASTATQGFSLDYTYGNITTSNGQGTTYDTVYINVKEDLVVENPETVVLRFINVSANAQPGADSVYTLTIIDNDTLTVSFQGALFSYVEADTLVQVRVTINSQHTDTIRVTVMRTSGNATVNVDFAFNDSTVTFLPNDIDTQYVWLTLKDDLLDEINEQVNFNLVNATGGTHIGVSACTVVIIDNDTTALGIDEAEFENSVKLYPNPAAHMLFLKTETDLQRVEIFDLLGNLVMNPGAVSAGNNNIDISQLPSGMYFIAFRNMEKAFSMRFVKNE